MTTTTTACQPLPYWPCEEGVPGSPPPGVRVPAPAANTDGHRCDDGFADYDEEPANGCEAEPDDLDDPEELDEDTGSVEGTIVPRDDVDAFVLPTDDRGLLCDGSVTVTLAAPEGMDLRLEVVREDGEIFANEGVGGGDEVSVEVGERCFVASDGDLEVVVRPDGADRTAEPYTLSRSGSF